MRFIRSISVTALVFAAACSGDDSGSSIDSVPPTAQRATTVATTTAPTGGATTLPTTTTARSTVPDTGATAPAGPSTTSDGGSTTTVACDAPTESVDVVEGFPGTLSARFGDDVDTGGHPCYERVVFTFAGTGDRPGFAVRYQPDPLAGVGTDPVDLRGDANLVVSVGTWMGRDGNFNGETQLFPTNVAKIREVTLLSNDAGVMTWGIGLDERRPFEVFVLQDPFRLVVDVATPPDA
jgi:hypothetical protein